MTKKTCKLRRMDHTGDTILAEYNPEVAESITVAQDELTKFMESCIKQFGKEPPVFAKRIGETSYGRMGNDGIQAYEDVILMPGLIGG